LSKPSINIKTYTICSGETFTYSPIDGTDGNVLAGTTYTWSAPTAAGLTGLAAGTNASNISGTLTNTTSSPINVTYSITPISGACTGNPFTVTVTVNPKPAINNKPLTVCSDAPFTFTPANGTDGTVPSGTVYTWSAPTATGLTGLAAGSSGTNISGTLTNTTNAAVTATYNVTATSGITPNTCTNTFTVTVTVNPKPAINNKPLTVCSGDPFTFTPANGTDGTIPSGTVYTWSSPTAAGLTGLAAGSSATNISGTLTNTTNAAVTAIYNVTATSGITPNTCTNTFTVSVTVNPKPSVVAVVNQQPTCPSPFGIINVSTPSGSNFEFSNNNGATYQPLPTFSNLAPGNYNIIVRNTTTGCVSNPSSSLTINPIPVAPATPTASVTVQPTCVVPTGTIVITDPTGTNLEYSVNGSSYQTGRTFNLLPPNPYNVTVRNTNTSCVSLPLSLTVNPIPGAPPAPTVGITNPTCSAPLTGNLTITNPLGPVYEYSINGINYQINPVFPGLTPNTYNVTVKETSTGCTSAVIIGTILPAPPVSPLPSAPQQPKYCVGDVPAGPFAASGINLQWYANPSGGIGSPTAPLPNTSTFGQKIYYVTQTIANGCESGRLPVTITVNPLPLVNAGPDQRINIGESVTLKGSATGNIFQILWSPSGTLSNGGILQPIATPKKNQSYTIRVVTTDGCVGTDDVNVVVIEPINIPNIFSPNGDGLNDLWIIDKIEQYPNAVVEIFNRYGNKIFERKGYSRSSAWDGTNKGALLPVGAYYYILRLGDDSKPRTGVISIIR
jgi:gliding motility-associated-like protein